MSTSGPIRRFSTLTATLVAAMLGLCASLKAQPTTPEPTKASAIKLPDGTVVFWTKNPDEANPSVEGVVLSPQDYKALVEQAEQARKAKSQSPSSVAIRGKIELRGERLVAALNLTYAFRTTQPRTLLVLGCQRGVLVAAKTGQGKLPILNPPGDDGLTLLVDAAGEQTVTLDVEVPVAPRGSKNELGFDLGLPKAAITTLKLDAPPSAGIKSVSLGTRVIEGATPTPLKPAEVKRFACTVDLLTAKPVPLGATDLLELTWESISPTSPNAVAIPAVQGDVSVHVEETQIEAVAKLKLRGNLKEWPFQFPVGTEVVVERASLLGPTIQSDALPATVVRPSDPNKPIWIIRTPGDGTAEWLVTATHRLQRPKPNEPKFRGPYPVGPFFLSVAAKQSGRINVFAAPTVRLSFKPLAEFRRQDLPATATDDHIALFTYTGLALLAANAKPASWLEIDARVAPTAIRAKTTHQLKLTPGGWRLESAVRIVPPPRGELEQVQVEMPADWPTLEATPEELVESIQIVKEGSPRVLAIRFNTPQKSAFTLNLLSTRALTPKTGSADERESKLVVALPRFPQMDERETSLTASVPEGFEVRGSISQWEGGQPSAAADVLTAIPGVPNRSAAVGAVSGTSDRGIARVELRWQPYRPALFCEHRVDVTLQPRQLLIQQVLKFKPSPDDRRAIRLRGPEGLLGLQSVPALDPIGPGVWEFRPTSEPGKEFSLSVAFALRLASPSADPAVQLLWPETTTRTETLLRVWGGATGRRVNGFVGDWRDLPPEPVPERDALPLLTLGSSALHTPLTLDLSSLGESGLPMVWIERATIRATLSESTVAIQERLLLKRWLGSSLELELPRVDSVEVLVDGKRIEAIPNAFNNEGLDPYLLTIPLPESKPNRSVQLEVRYRYTGVRTPARDRLCTPPHIRGAIYRMPVRWLLTTDPDAIGIVPNGKWEPEFRWVWRGWGFTPTASDSPQELEKWLTEGTDVEAVDFAPGIATGSEASAGRQSMPETIPVLLIPRTLWIILWSASVLLLGLGVAQLRKFWLGSALALLGLSLCIGGALVPQLLAQALAAMPPGALILALVLIGRLAWRTYQARRLERLPGFSRERQSTTAPVSLGPTNRESGSQRPSADAPRGTASSIPPITTGV